MNEDSLGNITLHVHITPHVGELATTGDTQPLPQLVTFAALLLTIGVALFRQSGRTISAQTHWLLTISPSTAIHDVELLGNEEMLFDAKLVPLREPPIPSPAAAAEPRLEGRPLH